jgi:DNA-binding MarR family transcriptional regulator
MAIEVDHLTPIEEAWSLISQLFWDLRPRMLSVAGEFGLTPPQMFALRVLDPEHPLPMRELAAHLHCDSSNVTGLVDRLTAQGLVERREAPHDRRVRMLAVTPEGARVRDRLRAMMLEVPPGLADLDLADQRTLRDVMRRARGVGGDSDSSISEPDRRHP